MTQPTLYTLEGSPWSFKTLWVVKYLSVRLAITASTPVITELFLQWTYGRKRITYPLLATPAGPLFESLDIAQWADARRSGGRSLFPEGHIQEIAQWNEKSDAMISLSRGTFVNNVLQDEAFARSIMPAPLTWLGPIGVWIIRLGVSRLGQKHAAAHNATNTDKCMKYLEELDAAVRNGGGYVVAGRFTYADITMATGLSLLDFLAEPWSKKLLSERGRKKLTPPEFAGKYPNLLAWRTKILENHFPSKEPL